jgi:hypothetical protein
MKENINSEPLLFIKTVNEKVQGKNQEVFDSRDCNKKIITKTHDTEFYVKISRLILMYNKNKRIICKVQSLTKEEFYVIVMSMNNNILTCLNIDTNNKQSFNINEIDEITIEEID